MLRHLPVHADDDPPRTAGRVLAVAKNYRAHVDAMGEGPAPGEAVFFAKPPEALRFPGEPLWHPPEADLHPEAELVAVIGRVARGVTADQALDHVAGFAAGLDMTDRRWQARAKQKGWPWERAKAFDGSAALGPVVPVARAGDWQQLVVGLEVDGEPAQQADPRFMLRGVPELIAEASQRFTLRPGDLIYTGAPAGTATVEAGATLTLSLGDLWRGDFPVSAERWPGP